ncbi:MAG: acyltransferase family protein [Bacteroidales bacterium]|nr:acyltransferase family protein [Bacteroidales bacterium]
MNQSDNRLYFFDNLRFVIIVFVVFLHSVYAYVKIGNVWPVVDSGGTGDVLNFILLRLNAFLDGFIMPTLFFIAGYFVSGSIKRYGAVKFLRKKLTRLGIPLVLLSIFFIPVIIYISLFSKSLLDNTTYLTAWLQYIKTAFDFSVKSELYNNTVFLQNFSPLHLWFLSLLLIFYILYVLIYSLKMDLPDRDHRIYNKKYFLPVVLIFILINTAAMFFSLQFFELGQWLIIAPFIMFQPDRVIFYFTLFLLGIYAFKAGWFRDRMYPGRLYIWILVLFVTMIGNIAFGNAIYQKLNSPQLLRLGFAFFRSLYCMTSVLLYSRFAYRFLNSNNVFHRNLAENSYYIYLLHFVFVVLFQLLFRYVTCIPQLVELGLVTSMTVITCFVISKYIIRKNPGVSVVLLFLLFVVMVMFL